MRAGSIDGNAIDIEAKRGPVKHKVLKVHPHAQDAVASFCAKFRIA